MVSDYCQHAQVFYEEQLEYKNMMTRRFALLFISCLPNIRFLKIFRFIKLGAVHGIAEKKVTRKLAALKARIHDHTL